MFYLSLNISTRSLTRRLTISEYVPADTSFNFNSQPHEEADDGVVFLIHIVIFYFNSQPHEEADHFRVGYCLNFQNFNSQPHEEADVDAETLKFIDENFNSQPHEEADRTCRANGGKC